MPVLSARKGRREGTQRNSEAANNPFLDAILPTVAKKRKVYESKFAEEDDGDEEAAEIRVDVKQEESRPVADPRENSTHKKRRSSYSGTEFAPHMHENESSTHQTTKSIKDPRDSAAASF